MAATLMGLHHLCVQLSPSPPISHHSRCSFSTCLACTWAPGLTWCLSFPAHGRKLLREASEAETSGECLLLLRPPPVMAPSVCSLSEVFFSSLQVDGVSYLLQEIYGIENKYNSQESKVNAGVGGGDASPSARPR